MKPIRLHNTLTRKTEELRPLDGKTIKMYTCGLTVYSQPHIGNWVGYIYWDVLIRTLRARGYTVERTQNYTDVGHLVSDDDQGEDKMEKGARTEGITAWQVADKFIAIADSEAYSQLRLLRPDHLLRATEYINQQIEFVTELEKNGYTYLIPGEGVYFDTSKLSDYGKLARLDITGLEAGARVEIAGKHHTTDFALWKLSPANKKRDMEWDSPWGKGFPGWHLECSIIARESLGDQIDVHTGGIDHIPVHHTNEIAQTEAITGKQFSQFWIHNNHLKVEGGKMSKSLGNIYTLKDITDRGFTYNTFKLFILNKHYRTEGNFTWDSLEATNQRLLNWQSVADLRYQSDSLEDASPLFDLASIKANLLDALADDLATPRALAVLDTVFNDIAEKGTISSSQLDDFINLLSLIDDLLGVDLTSTEDIANAQKKRIKERALAKEARNWQESDAIRDELKATGIGLKDTQYGTKWYRTVS